MRRVKLSFRSVLASLVALALVPILMPVQVFAVNTENFYFEDFTGDYYLSRDAEGVSHLKVVESFTTIFPDYKQNKGICRMIPFTNQDNANLTLPRLTRSDIKITRNGISEPIYSIEKSGNYYEVCTGDENYVLGKQVYTFEYNFEKVVTDFSNYQELYWDTNGNGWTQKFESVTARVHFVGDVAKDYAGKSWCYVGRYGVKGSERCTISEISDGVKFEAKNLTRYENLTFDTELKAGSFAIPEPEDNYTLVFIMIGFLTVCILLLIRPYKKFLKAGEKRRYYKEFFVKPEYAPNPNYGIAEMAANYIGHKKDAKVAVLLDLIVQKKVSLIQKGETRFGRKKWAMKVVDAKGISEEGMYLLRILAGGGHVKDGDEFEIKKRTATSSLVLLKNNYELAVKTDLERHELVEKKTKKSGLSAIIWCFAIFFGLPLIVVVIEAIGESDFSVAGVRMVGSNIFVPVMACIFIAMVIVYNCLSAQTKKFSERTKKGLEASRYMDGLKLYIEMAEKDRLKFLQSVKGVDVSPEGIVNLYEKLLPYAAVLGLEESWMKELEKYYKLEEVQTPDWYVGNMATYSILSAVNSAASTVNYSTTYASSGGSSSSRSSGGGGGGFSGGGGGGGGGHGR